MTWQEYTTQRLLTLLQCTGIACTVDERPGWLLVANEQGEYEKVAATFAAVHHWLYGY